MVQAYLDSLDSPPWRRKGSTPACHVAHGEIAILFFGAHIQTSDDGFHGAGSNDSLFRAYTGSTHMRHQGAVSRGWLQLYQPDIGIKKKNMGIGKQSCIQSWYLKRAEQGHWVHSLMWLGMFFFSYGLS